MGPSPPSPPPAATALTGDGELILLVDDEQEVSQMLERTLIAFGYRVAIARDGAEALARFTAGDTPFALIITDRMMPVMDGTALIAAVRGMNRKIPIIAITGSAADHRTGELERPGIDQLVSKPFANETLLRTVKAALAAGRERVASSSP